nr:MAG TPA: minor tail protein [Caudoviricetes sp.]
MKVLRPALIVINKLLSRIIALGNAISTAFGGNKVEDTSKGLNSTASSAEDLTNNLANSNEEAKELKKNLMSFDELNTLDDSGSKEDSSNSNVDLGIPTLDIKIDDSTVDPQLQKIAEKIKAWRDKIVSFFSDKTIKEALTDLGKAILNGIKQISTDIYKMIVDQLERIDWKDALLRLTAISTYLVQDVTDTVHKIIETVKNILDGMNWNWIIAGVLSAFYTLSETVLTIVNTIVDTLNKLAQQLGLSDIINALLGQFGLLDMAC